MDYNDRLTGTFSAPLPALRTSGSGCGGYSDHARADGRRASIVVSRPARKLPQPSSISIKGHGRPGWMRNLIHAITENSLSIVLFVLFAICISGDSSAGWRLQNETLAAHGQASISYWHFLSTGSFLGGLASNWQAAALQLGSLVLFSSFLYQRGAPHSLDPRGETRADVAQGWALHLVLPPFASPGVFASICFLACASCRLRCQSIQRATLTRGPVAILYRGIHPFRQILGDNSVNLAGRISSDRAICLTHHLPASAGLAGVEAGRIKQRNDWRGEQMSEMLPAEAPVSFPIIRLLTMLPHGKL